MRQIKCRLPHMAGQDVGADSGRLYRVDPSTRLLHELSHGVPAAEPGVDDVDVPGFLAAGYPEVKASARALPPPPPVGGGAGQAVVPDAVAPALPPALAALPPLPAPVSAMTEAQWNEVKGLHQTRDWLRVAADAGVVLTPDEQATKPKVALVQFIYTRAVEGA